MAFLIEVMVQFSGRRYKWFCQRINLEKEMIYIKVLSILLIVLGLFSTFFGLIPFFVKFPEAKGGNSGPANFGELLIYLAYDGKGWYLSIGIIMLLLGLFLLLKIKNILLK